MKKLKRRIKAFRKELDIQTTTVSLLITRWEKLEARVRDLEDVAGQLGRDIHNPDPDEIEDVAATVTIDTEAMRQLMAGHSIVTHGYKITHVGDQA